MRLLACTLAVSLALGGCASQGVRFRSMPAETPAADNAAKIRKAQALAATQKAEAAKAAEAPAGGEAPPAPLTAADAPPMQTFDPFERLNRFTYRFNARFDEALFLPVANGYRHIPSPLRAGVHNFFGNLVQIDSVINYALQGRWHYSLRSLGRFAVNTTIGIGGLFDVASHVKLANPPTGFGTTLAKWGMHPGPYLVLPLLGPSSAREGVGLLGDYGTNYAINIADLYRGNQSWAAGVVNAIDQRANVDFRYYSTGSPFEYDTIRFLYVRKLLIEDAALHKSEPPKRRDPAIPAGQ